VYLSKTLIIGEKIQGSKAAALTIINREVVSHDLPTYCHLVTNG
jgi:hypothetical protein